MRPADATPAGRDLQPLPAQGDTEDRAETVEPPTDHAPLERPTATLFRHRAFMRLWCSRLFGTTANQMLLVALGWVVPRGVRPIAAVDVAAALVQATARGAPGVKILASGDMQGAAAG